MRAVTTTDPLCRYAGNIVTIEVGTRDKTEFRVHEFIIKENSDFFRAALDKKWKEGQSLTVKLPEDSPETFSAYVEWLYSTKDNEAEFVSLAEMYVLGEKIQSSTFCDAVIEEMLRACNASGVIPSINAVNALYSGTPPFSPARRFMADVWALKAEPEWLKDGDYDEEPHPEFVTDLAIALLSSYRTSQIHELSRMDSWFKG